MTPKETPSNEHAGAAPSSEAAAGAVAPKPEAFLGRLLDLFRQSLAQDGEKAYLRWGLPLFQSMEDEEAEGQKEALGIQPVDALDHYNRGCLLALREQWSEAIKMFDKAIAQDSTLVEAYFNRALALEKSGDLKAAREAWNAWIERFGDRPEASDVKQHLGALADA